MKKITKILGVMILCYSSMLLGKGLSVDNAKLKIVQRGLQVNIKADSHAAITSQLVALFNTCSISTRETWLRQAWEKQGKTISDIWRDIKVSSYFSIAYPETNDTAEVIVSINEEKYSLGAVMSKSRTGEIIGYVKCSGHEHLKLICMPQVKILLPKHYVEYKYYESNCATVQ